MLAADDVEEEIKAALHKQSLGGGPPQEGKDRPRREDEGDRGPVRRPDQGARGPPSPHPPRAAQALRGPLPEEGRHRPVPRHGRFLRHVPHARPPADAQRDPGQGEGHPLRELRPDPLLDRPSPSPSRPSPRPPNKPRPASADGPPVVAPLSASSLYRASIASWYSAVTLARRTLREGVISPFSMSKSRGRTTIFLIRS